MKPCYPEQGGGEVLAEAGEAGVTGSHLRVLEQERKPGLLYVQREGMRSFKLVGNTEGGEGVYVCDII